MNEGTTHSDVLSVAPMIQWTDRHWRYFMRQITRKTVLYSEMTLDSALVYNTKNLDPFLGHEECEHPLVVQLGGCDPAKLGEAASICESYSRFSEINLNCGCPSNRAKKCGFGAELMLDPELVQRICYEMKRKTTMTDITVKCRLGVTGKESFEDLVTFISGVQQVGIKKVILHARMCILKGLSPAQNRTVPPLLPEVVHKIVELFPDMKFIYNGGINSFEDAHLHLGNHHSDIYKVNPVHGVMIGREAYNNPFSLRTADSVFFDQSSNPLEGKSKKDVLNTYVDYMMRMKELEPDCHHPKHIHGTNCCNLMKPLHNFFQDCSSSLHNHLYKQKLDSLIKQYSKEIDSGRRDFREVVELAIEDTIPKEELEAPLLK
jgi:tRNA-dihydrouridine synthase A